MVEAEENNGNVINNNPSLVRSMPCHNSPRRMAHMARTPTKFRQAELKIGLLQIIYVNPFAGFDHEDPFTHLTKFYELVGTLGTSKVEEESIFMRLFPHSLIVKAKDLYLDQLEYS